MKIFISILAWCLMLFAGLTIFDGCMARVENVWQLIAARMQTIGGLCVFGLGLVALAGADIAGCVERKNPEK